MIALLMLACVGSSGDTSSTGDVVAITCYRADDPPIGQEVWGFDTHEIPGDRGTLKSAWMVLSTPLWEAEGVVIAGEPTQPSESCPWSWLCLPPTTLDFTSCTAFLTY